MRAILSRAILQSFCDSRGCFVAACQRKFCEIPRKSVKNLQNVSPEPHNRSSVTFSPRTIAGSWTQGRSRSGVQTRIQREVLRIEGLRSEGSPRRRVPDQWNQDLSSGCRIGGSRTRVPGPGFQNRRTEGSFTGGGVSMIGGTRSWSFLQPTSEINVDWLQLQHISTKTRAKFSRTCTLCARRERYSHLCPHLTFALCDVVAFPGWQRHRNSLCRFSQTQFSSFKPKVTFCPHRFRTVCEGH